jgi:hypothetical protein
MRQRIFRRARQDEEGAVLVIVTLSLIALFGMMVLVVDVGSLLFTRRALVNAADAAALAAAQSCGQKEGIGAANAQANQYTVANESGAAVASGFPKYFPSCDNPWGFVRVRVSADRPLYFAPVLGFDSDTPVATEAMASWGGAGAGEKVAPLMLSAHRLGDCDIPPPDPNAIPPGGVDCYFWWNNSSPGSTRQDQDLMNAEWGSLDLLKWDVTTAVGCDNSTPPEFSEWMLEGYFEPLPIDSSLFGAVAGDGLTFVCRGQGNRGGAFDNIIDDAITAGNPLYFPVNDPQTQVDRNGVSCPPAPPGEPATCSVDKYNIIGFAKMDIISLWRGKNESLANCSHIPEAEADANARCMLVRWKEYTPDGLDPQGGENFGLVPVRLVE